MLTRRTLVTAALSLAIAGGLAVRASAAPNPDAASKFITDLAADALRLVEEDRLKSQANVGKFRDLFRANFDVPYISRFVLGRFWGTATAEQQQEYQRLFEDWVVSIYAERFGQYSGETLKVTGARPEGERDALVGSQIVRPNAQTINLEWRVRESGGRLKIIDVAVENASMSRTQRQDFESIILRNGGRIEPLLDELRRRIQTAATPR